MNNYSAELKDSMFLPSHSIIPHLYDMINLDQIYEVGSTRPPDLIQIYLCIYIHDFSNVS